MKSEYRINSGTIRTARTALELTQYQYAMALGAMPIQVSRWECDAVSPNRTSQAKILVHAQKNNILFIFEVSSKNVKKS